MTDMPSHPRLSKRGNVFWHRAAIPADIRSTYPKTEETFSLKTKDPREAIKRVRIAAMRVDAQFQAHRDQQKELQEPPLRVLTDDQEKALSHAFFASILSEDEGERLKGFGEVDFATYNEDIKAVENTARELYARGQVPGFLKEAFEKTTKLLDVNWRLADGSQSWARMSREFLAATIKASEIKKRRQNGDVVETPRVVPLAPSRQLADTQTTITSLFELWKRDHLANGKTEQTVADYQQKVRDFVAYLGHDNATSVTQLNVATYCDVLRHERGLSARTVSDKYLATIRSLYRLGKGKAVIAVDPTENVRVRVPKKIVERSKGFTDAEAVAILSCASRDPSYLGGMAEHNKLAIRWVPWICAYTGARAGEITQLRRDDIIEEYGIPCVRITSEDGSVKTGVYRIVPIHPHLVEIGLLDFIRSRPPGPLFYIANKRLRTRGRKQSNGVTGKVSDWVRRVVKLTDPRVQPTHGWRHRFKTIARDVDISPRYMDAIQGHSDGSAGGEYGENTMKALYREICKLPRYVESHSQA